MGEAKLRALRAVNFPGLNHTSHASLIYRPIAVSIETRLSTGTMAEATLQLQTWAKAQVMFLREVLKPGATIPPLPLIMVQDHDWVIWYFIDQGQDAVGYYLSAVRLLSRSDTIHTDTVQS